MCCDGHHCANSPLLHCAGVISVLLHAKGLAFWKGGIQGNGRKGLGSEA